MPTESILCNEYYKNFTFLFPRTLILKQYFKIIFDAIN